MKTELEIIFEMYSIIDDHLGKIKQLRAAISALNGESLVETPQEFIEACNQQIKEIESTSDPVQETVDPPPDDPIHRHKKFTKYANIKCEVCGSWFTPKRATQRGCREKCQKYLSIIKQRARARESIRVEKSLLPSTVPKSIDIIDQTKAESIITPVTTAKKKLTKEELDEILRDIRNTYPMPLPRPDIEHYF